MTEFEDEEPGPDVIGRVGPRILRERCSSCIFRPGNPMALRDGRLADLTAVTDRADTNVVCHQTLDGAGAFCRGSVDRAPGQIVRIAARLGVIEYVDP